MTGSARLSTLPRGHEPVVSSDKTEIDKIRFPDLADLMARLHFSTSDGRIWLDDQRMLLLHAKSLHPGHCLEKEIHIIGRCLWLGFGRSHVDDRRLRCPFQPFESGKRGNCKLFLRGRGILSLLLHCSYIACLPGNFMQIPYCIFD